MFKNLIGGEWVEGPRVSRNINPSDTRDVVGEYAQADAAQARQAIAAAAQAQPAWGLSTPQQRFDILDAAGTEILARKAELGDLLAREEGKTLPEAIGEVARAGNIFKFFAGEALRVGGDVVPSVRPGVGVEVTREPVGVVGLITPWNFPIAIPAWKIAPALAYGNAVVFKPADLVPGCAWAIADILHRAGLPAGVFNLVMGRGSEVGQVLLDDKRVDAISFTGSVATGQRIAQACVARMAKFQLEMGGKNPLVVLDDADLDVAVNAAREQRLLLHRPALHGVVAPDRHRRHPRPLRRRGGREDEDAEGRRRAQEGHRHRPGGRRQAARAGPRVRRDRHGRRRQAGGRRRGDRQKRRRRARLLPAPALFTETTAPMRINREEVFGPVVSVIRAKDYDEALALANDTEFGLSAGIATTSLKHATHFKRHAQAGMVMVNLPTAGVDYHVPFGGRKGSSYGPREQGRYAAEFYTTVKTAYTAA